MNLQQLKKYINDSRFCSSTEKCAVACATKKLSIAGFCDDLDDAWRRLDDDQKAAVKQYRFRTGTPPYGLDRVARYPR